MTALVISRVRYCLTVYGNGTQKNFDRLQKILNFAARVIFGRRKFDHVSDLRQKARVVISAHVCQNSKQSSWHTRSYNAASPMNWRLCSSPTARSGSGTLGKTTASTFHGHKGHLVSDGSAIAPQTSLTAFHLSFCSCHRPASPVLPRPR